MTYSLDCFMVNLSTNFGGINAIYLRMILAILMPVFFLIIYFAIYGLIIAIRRAKCSKSIIFTSLIYMFLYMQPNIVQG